VRFTPVVPDSVFAIKRTPELVVSASFNNGLNSTSSNKVCVLLVYFDLPLVVDICDELIVHARNKQSTLKSKADFPTPKSETGTSCA